MALMSVALLFFLILGVACASDVDNVSSVENLNDNSDLLSSHIEEVNGDADSKLSDDSYDDNSSGVNDVLSVSSADSNDVVGALGSTKASETAVVKVTSPSTLIKNDYFTLKLTYKNGKAIVGKKVSITVNGKTYDKTTNSNGLAQLKMSFAKNYYTVSYTFNEKGFETVKGKADVLVLTKSASTLKGSNYVAYKGFTNYYRATLTADGIKIKNKKIKFSINGMTYYKKTNANGNAHLPIELNAGKYTIKYSFAGEKNLDASSGKATVTVKQRMPTKVSRANSAAYYAQTSAPFKVKVLDARGNPVPGNVVFAIDGKRYTKAINSNGIATINLKLSQGNHRVSFAFCKNSKYERSVDSKIIYVGSSKTVNNGFWVFGSDMKDVDLKTLQKYGTKHIFLNYYALKVHGKAAVESFIKDANARGIKVHIWMQIFYDGDWISPVYDGGSYKYSYFKTKINEAKKYAALKGVAGIHLDYLRFPGTAYKHTNGVAAINYFTKELCNAIHGMNPKLIVSAAVMPEVDSNKYFYGQDIPTLSKYLDVIIPMVYKGNYESGTSWIKSTTQAIVKMSKGAEIWTGLQTYNSDEDVTRLPASELLTDARSASAGGATGVILFRLGITNMINFVKV